MRTNKFREKTVKGIMLMAAIFSTIVAIFIFIFLIRESIPALRKVGFNKFVFGTEWDTKYGIDKYTDVNLQGSYGIATTIVGTIYVTILSVIMGGVVGVFAAIFLSQFLNKKVSNIITQVINVLAGIPSVIYGFFGLVVIKPMLGKYAKNGSGTGILSVSIVLAIMILPTIISLSKNAIDGVPRKYYDGARALGESHISSVFGSVVPNAKSGIFASIILGIGRAVGETMAVAMLAGNAKTFPRGIFGSFSTMTSHIVNGLGELDKSQVAFGAMVATGSILLIFIVVIIYAFNKVVNRKPKEYNKKPKDFYLQNGGVHKIGFVNNKIKKLIKYFLYLFLLIMYILHIFLDFGKVKSTTHIIVGSISASVLLISVIAIILEIGERTYTVKKVRFKKQKGKIVIKVKALDITRFALSFICVSFAIFSLFSIIIYIFIKGIPNLKLSLFVPSGGFSGPPTILPSIVATMMLVALALLISVPIGIFSAIYLNEYADKNSKLIKVIRMGIEVLAGVPSIVFALFGVVFFVNFFRLGVSIIAGALTITLMVTPVIIKSVEESLKIVPNSYRAGSYALGAGKARTIFKAVLPSALPGILAAIILAMGRIVSESAPIMFTMGGGAMPHMPKGFRSKGTSLAVMMYYLSGEGLYVKEAYATASILIFIILILNIISTIIVERLEKKLLGKGA